MRQQEGIDDDNRHDGQLDSGNHQEGYGRQKRHDKEGGNHHQENLDQKEGGPGCLVGYFSSSIAVTCSVTARLRHQAVGHTISARAHRVDRRPR